MRKTMRKTVDDFMKARPCDPYTRERIWELVGDEGITPKELVQLNIPGRDILWALILVWMTPQQCLEFAKACVDKAKDPAGVSPDFKASTDAINETKRAMMQTEISAAIGDERLARESAWKAAEAVINAAWMYRKRTFSQGLLTTAFSIIGEEKRHESKTAGKHKNI